MTNHPEICAVYLDRKKIVYDSIFRSTLFLTIIAISSISAPVLAQTPVNDCTFSNPLGGRIGLSKDGRQRLGSNPDLYNFASTGYIDFGCTTNATMLMISDPIQMSGSTISTGNVAVVETGSGLVSSPNGTGNKSIVLKAGIDRVKMKIDLENSFTTQILSGNYAYKIILTIAPN